MKARSAILGYDDGPGDLPSRALEVTDQEILWDGTEVSLSELLPSWAISVRPAPGGGYLAQAANNRGTLVVRAVGTTIEKARQALIITGAQEIVLPAQLASMGWHVSPCLDEECQHDLVVARERPPDPASEDRDLLWAFRVSTSDDSGYGALRAIQSHFTYYSYVAVDVHALSLSPAVVLDRDLLGFAIESEREATVSVVDIDYEREAEVLYERDRIEARADAVASGVPEDLVDDLLVRAEFEDGDPINDWHWRQRLRRARLSEGIPEELVDEVIDHQLAFGRDPYQ